MNESVYAAPIKKGESTSYLLSAALSARGEPQASWEEGHSHTRL